jgi:PAS domain S-box-containing protein
MLFTGPTNSSRHLQGRFSSPRSIAFVCALLGFAARIALQPVMGNESPLLVFHLAVMVAAYLGGKNAGLLTTALSLILGWYFLVEPRFSFRIVRLADLSTILVFSAVGAAISFLGGKLKDLQALQTAILNSALDAVVASDAKGRVIEWNEACERVFGYTRDEAIGRDMAALIIPEEMRDAHHAGMDRMRRTGEGPILGKRLQMPALRADGSTFPCELVVNRINCLPLRFTGFIRDVTEQKRQENALIESEERFRTMADSAPVLIWMSGPHDEGVYFNQRWVEFTGRTLEDELGQGWLDAIHPEDLSTLEARSKAFAVKQPFKTQFRMRRFDGEYRHMLDTGVPRFAPNGAFEGYIGSCSDITDLKKYEEERSRLLAYERNLRSQAELASRMKDEFLATLSHELRTPLNSILGWSQVLRRLSADPAQLSRGLDAIERNARSQTRIIEDLLDMSRVVSGKIRLDVQSVDLAQVAADAVETVRPAAEAKGIALQLFVDTSAGPIKGDPQRLQQVLWNLLANATKFTPTGGKIQVRLGRVDSHVEISVEDDGEGIEPAFLPFVFDRFRQADASTTRRHGGLGLGLSIVRSLVEAHGGTVSAMSGGVGKGSTFIVSLPLTPGHLEEDVTDRVPTTAEPRSLQHEYVDLSGVTLLVVDDEPDGRELIKEMLRASGAHVVTAGSAEEGLELLKNGRLRVYSNLTDTRARAWRKSPRRCTYCLCSAGRQTSRFQGWIRDARSQAGRACKTNGGNRKINAP